MGVAAGKVGVGKDGVGDGVVVAVDCAVSVAVMEGRGLGLTVTDAIGV